MPTTPAPAVPQPAPLPLNSREAALRERILVLRATIEELTNSLALANAEAETFRRQTEDLALKLEALGPAALDPKPGSLEEKLVAATRDLREEQKRALRLEDALLALSESVITLLQEVEGISPQARADLEARLRLAQELLGFLPMLPEAQPAPASLTNALVLETHPKLALLILNVGRQHGARIGAPFRILRGREIIAQALIVDARERISGAIIQRLENENNPPQPGDRAIVITQQSPF